MGVSSDADADRCGAVLAGGASRRMGRPKHALEIDGGRTMLDAVAAALDELCGRVVVAGGDGETSHRVIGDLRPGQGPLAGIEALLASGLARDYVVCPCDVPLVTAALLSRLVAATAAPATVFRVEGEPRAWPLPARIAAGALAEVAARLDRGERSVHGLMDALDPHVVEISRADARQLANVNTPQEYARLTASRPAG